MKLLKYLENGKDIYVDVCAEFGTYGYLDENYIAFHEGNLLNNFTYIKIWKADERIIRPPHDDYPLWIVESGYNKVEYNIIEYIGFDSVYILIQKLKEWGFSDDVNN